MRRLREVTVTPPTELAAAAGLAYALWLPPEPPRAAVLILHGAGSCKESHFDFARAVVARGLAALAFDQRGHGESGGRMDGRALDDVAAMAARLRERAGGTALPLAVRGSSMGGYLALVSAAGAGAGAVVAVCPASGAGLRRGLEHGRLGFAADVPALEALLSEHDVSAAAGALEIPVLLLHAEGDEQVPVEHSRELARELRHPASRLITVPGGHHRSVQHDAELQAASLRFIERALVSGAG
jgi:alpha-beta hydrolase superfamily lysophospholipase